MDTLGSPPQTTLKAHEENFHFRGELGVSTGAHHLSPQASAKDWNPPAVEQVGGRKCFMKGKGQKGEPSFPEHVVIGTHETTETSREGLAVPGSWTWDKWCLKGIWSIGRGQAQECQWTPERQMKETGKLGHWGKARHREKMTKKKDPPEALSFWPDTIQLQSWSLGALILLGWGFCSYSILFMFSLRPTSLGI